MEEQAGTQKPFDVKDLIAIMRHEFLVAGGTEMQTVINPVTMMSIKISPEMQAFEVIMMKLPPVLRNQIIRAIDQAKAETGIEMFKTAKQKPTLPKNRIRSNKIRHKIGTTQSKQKYYKISLPEIL